MSSPIRLVALAALTVLTGTIAACGPKPDPYMESVYDPKTGKLQMLKWDRDHNGQMDAWGHMEGTKLLKIDIDTSGDGKPDRWEHYDGTPNMTKAEISTQANGQIDRIEYFDHGKITRVDADGDGDGRMDRWETYDAGRLASIAFDTGHHGFADRRILYGADGSQRMELDPDGDGKFVAAPAASGAGKSGRR